MNSTTKTQDMNHFQAFSEKKKSYSRHALNYKSHSVPQKWQQPKATMSLHLRLL